MVDHGKTNFVILSGPRTGSSAFRLWLNNHEQVRCHDEVLLKSLDTPDAIRHYTDNSFPNINLDEKNISYANTPEINQLLNSYLTSLYTNPKHSAPWVHFDKRRETYTTNDTFQIERAVGFKFMYYLLDNPLLSQWMSSGTTKILHLSRENKLKQYLSYLTAKQTNLYHSEFASKTTKITIETDNIIDILNHLTDGTEKIHNHFNRENYLRVSYEDFFENPENISHTVAAFLNVDDKIIQPPSIKKINSDCIKDIVENYDELTSALMDSKFRNLI